MYYVTVRRTLAGALFLSTMLTPGVAAQDATQTDLLRFNIPSQNTASALNEFARQADVQLLFPYDAAAVHNCTSLQGYYTRSTALIHFISGTGLVVASATDKAITLRTADGESGGDDAIETVVVSGQRLSQKRSIDEKRSARAIEDVISADDIGQIPDKNAAESVERLPGVSLSYDKGEGHYVNIRGVGAALNSVTLNGISLGSPDYDSRAMPLDVVSGQLVSRIEVVKSVTADMDAQGVGGSVNLVTQSSYDFDRDYMARMSLQTGYDELNGKNPVGADVSAGGVFGSNRQFGLLIGGNYSDRDFNMYGIYPDNWRTVDGSRRGLPTLIKASRYRIDHERIGGNFAFDYRPGEQDKFYLRGLWSDFNELVHRERYRIDFATDDMIGDGDTVLNSDGESGSFTGASQVEDYVFWNKRKTIVSLSAGGVHARGPWELSYDGAYVKDLYHQHNYTWTFKGGAIDGTFDMHDTVFNFDATTDADASDLAFSKLVTQRRKGGEESWVGGANLRRDFDTGFGGGTSFVKMGVKYRATVKTVDYHAPAYKKGSAGFTLADDDLNAENTETHIGGKTITMTPAIDYDALKSFTKDNIDNSSYFALDEDTTFDNEWISDYNVQESVLAGYAMGQIGYGTLTAIAGLRIEYTDNDAQAYEVVNEATASPVHARHNYTSVLPNIHLNWKPSDEVIVRVAYTNTIGRPEYADLAPATSLSYESSGSEEDSYEGSADEGNGDLKPYKSFNYDLSAEYYPRDGTMVSLGGFYKFIKNPIYTYEETLYNTDYDGISFSQLDYSQPRNARFATVSGMEINYQQQFDFLPGAWSGLGLAANLTVASSRLHMADRDDHLPFPQQSSPLYSIQIFYQKYGIQGSLSYHFSGNYLDEVSDARDADTWFNAYRRLNAKISYDLTDRISVYASAQNLLDEPLWEYQGGRKSWVTGYERNGRTFYMGVSAHL